MRVVGPRRKDLRGLQAASVLGFLVPASVVVILLATRPAADSPVLIASLLSLMFGLWISLMSISSRRMRKALLSVSGLLMTMGVLLIIITLPTWDVTQLLVGLLYLAVLVAVIVLLRARHSCGLNPV